ncbi:zf-HC2 domain-containing protein [Streptomyces virginiae]
MYVRGGLDAGERESIAAHLPGCERCRKAVDKFRELGDFVDRMPDPEC